MTHAVLPSPTSLAHAVRYGGQRCADLARDYGVSWQAVHDRLERGGFDTHGDPIEHQAPTPRPRLKDADNGYTNHVGGSDVAVSTDPVVHGRRIKDLEFRGDDPGLDDLLLPPGPEPETLCDRYRAGEALPTLAREFAMTPADVVRHLREAEVPIRGGRS